MTASSFGKILIILDLFSVSRPVINVDIICDELGLSKPTGYRYLKELVACELLQRLNGTSGDYILGSKIAILDYISRTSDPVIQASRSYMQDIAERTELCCLLTYLHHDFCIDLHHEVFQNADLFSYGRGCPRPLYIGSSPKVIMSQFSKRQIQTYYQRFKAQLANVNFAQDEDEFLAQMKVIKKQGYYLSKGELDPNVSGLSVPIKSANHKDSALALTLVASKNRFEFINIEKLIELLKSSAAQIETQLLNLPHTSAK